MTDKQRVLIITSEFPPQPGGIGNHALNLAKALCDKHLTVNVITDQRSENGTEESSFDACLPFYVTRIKRYKFRVVMYVLRLFKTFKAIKSSDVVIATGKFSLWNVALCNLYFKRKSIAIIHGTEVNFKAPLLKKLVDLSLQKFKNIIAVSEYTKTLVKHLNQDVKVIPNGINITEWKPNGKLTSDLMGNPKITTVGRVSNRKGQLQVIKHLPELVKQWPNIHYHCVGIPQDADKFLEVAKSLAVDKHISFHGSLPQEHLVGVLQQTDVFIMLSSESNDGDVEGFGIAILEANALSVPAIGAKGCGIEDAIKSNETGQLVQADNAEEFVNAMDTILKHTTYYKTNALKWAQDHDWSIIVNRYLKEIL